MLRSARKARLEARTMLTQPNHTRIITPLTIIA
jgi:hypothetical protein